MAGNIPPIGNAEEKKNKNGQGIKAIKHYNCQLLGNTSESFWYAMYAEIVCIVDFKCIRYFNKWKEFDLPARFHCEERTQHFVDGNEEFL